MVIHPVEFDHKEKVLTSVESPLKIVEFRTSNGHIVEYDEFERHQDITSYRFNKRSPTFYKNAPLFICINYSGCLLKGDLKDQ